MNYLGGDISFLGNSMPNFFVAVLLIYVFAIKMQIFPVIAKDMSISSAFLPALTLTIAMSAKYLRQIRAVVLDELDKAYVIGAKSRGISFSIILFNNVLRVTLVTIITLLALSIGSLLVGTAIIESIFMWDGVGKLAVDSILMRDYPVIQAYALLMAIIFVVINLIADILYGIIDQRIRLLGESN